MLRSRIAGSHGDSVFLRQWLYHCNLALPNYIPTNSVVGFPFLCTLFSPAFVICKCFNDGWCEVITHCSFDLHFSKKLVILSVFACAYWPFACLRWRKVYLGLLLIFQLSLFCCCCCWVVMRCLYILQIKPLLATVSDKGSISEICKELLQLYENHKK